MPGKANLSIYQGDDYQLVVLFKVKATGEPLPVTGHTFKAQVRKSTADEDGGGDPLAEFACMVTDGPNGTVLLELDHTQTTALTERTAAWDMQGTDTGGYVTTYLAGSVTVTPEVTR